MVTHELSTDETGFTHLILRNPDGVLVLDSTGVILFVNPAAETMFGRSAAALVGKMFGFPIVLGEAAEIDLLTAQGAAIAEIRVVAIDWHGDPAYLAMLRDVTERKQLEAALRASETRLQAVVENTDNLVWSIDREYRLQVANSAFQQSMTAQLGRQLAVGESVLHAASPPPASSFWQSLYDRALAGERISLEMASQGPRPGAIIECHLSPIRAADGAQVTGVTGLSRDISERKLAEQQLQQLNAELEQQVAARTAELTATVAALQRANAGKDAFMAAVSHELRTPLIGILSMSELLQAQTRGALNPDQVRYVEMVHENGVRLLATVNAVLLYAGLMTGATPVRHERCRLADLCARALRSSAVKAAAKCQTIALEVEPADLEITSDAEGLINILAMLLDNAVKFTPNGGAIGVRASHAASEDAVQLVVRDSGIGMSADEAALLFEPFTQADQGLTRHFAGVGIGLAYVGAMVKLLGGVVTVESALGQGSQFCVRLPIDNQGIGARQQ